MIDIAGLITSWGYPAVFLGAILEGETVVTLSGFAANRGYLRVEWVIVFATLGAFAGDQALFWLGHLHGPIILQRFPRLQSAVSRAKSWIERFPALAIIGFRFIYGMKIAGALALGIVGVSPRTFVLLNAIGAALWASIFSIIGYGLGHVAFMMLPDVKPDEVFIGALIVVGAFLVYLLRRHRAG